MIHDVIVRARRRASRPRAIRRGAIAALAGVALLAPAASATAAVPAPVEQGYQTAAADNPGYQVQAGPRLRKEAGFRTEWLGLLETSGELGICIDYGLPGPDGRWSVGKVPAKGKTGQAVAYAVNRHWSEATSSDRAAAALKSTVNRLVSADFRHDWSASYVSQLRRIDSGVVPLSDRWLAEARRMSGPVKAIVALGKPSPGEAATATARVTAGGRPLSGAEVTWSASGAKVGHQDAVTGAKGIARIKIVRGAGPVSVRATVRAPSTGRVWLSRPTAGRQRLIRGGITDEVSASARYDSRARVDVSSACDSTCDGRPPVTVRASAGDSAVRWQAVVDGRVLGTLAVAPGTSGRKTFRAEDGDELVLRYAVRVGGKWSPWREGETFDVVCPAWPSLTFAGDCGCEGGRVAVVVTAPAGDRTYVVDLAGRAVRLSGGEAARASIPARDLPALEVTFSVRDAAGAVIGRGTLTPW